MLYRLLGKFFFLFFICPFIREVGALIIKNMIKYADAQVALQKESDEEEKAKSRRNHPAGSRLP